MDVLVDVGQFLADSFLKLWSAIGSWGVIGFLIIAPFILRKIGNLIRKVFQF